MRRRLEGCVWQFSRNWLRKICEPGSQGFQFSRFPDTQNDRQENIVHTFTMFMFCYGLWFHQEWKRFANTETTKIFISKCISNLFPTFLGKILNLFNFCLLLFCIEKKIFNIFGQQNIFVVSFRTYWSQFYPILFFFSHQRLQYRQIWKWCLQRNW